MGLLSVLSRVGGAAIAVAKKVYNYCTIGSAVSDYKKLETFVSKYSKSTDKEISAPNFNENQQINEELRTVIAEVDKKHEIQASEFRQAQKVMVVQVELSRLRSSADLIDRCVNNVKIHASSLTVHYQNMENISNLSNEIDDIKTTLQNVMEVINHNAAISSNQNIKQIDIPQKNNANNVSLIAAYDAFDRTRELLVKEIYDLSVISCKHLNDLEILKIKGAELGGDLGRGIVGFIDRKIHPIIKNAETVGILLTSEVALIPSAKRDNAGLLMFDNGIVLLNNTDNDK